IEAEASNGARQSFSLVYPPPASATFTVETNKTNRDVQLTVRAYDRNRCPIAIVGPQYEHANDTMTLVAYNAGCSDGGLSRPDGGRAPAAAGPDGNDETDSGVSDGPIGAVDGPVGAADGAIGAVDGPIATADAAPIPDAPQPDAGPPPIPTLLSPDNGAEI